MSDPIEKTRENRSRRAAERLDLLLVKVPQPPPDKKKPGKTLWKSPSRWLVVDPSKDKIVSGLLLLTIDEIEAFLAD